MVPARGYPGRKEPVRPITGRLLAVLLGGLFIAAVLVISVKAFGAAGHRGLGWLVGISCLVTSGSIYLIGARKRR